MKTVVLGIAGEFLSGKSSAAAFYERKFEAKNLRFSQILDTVLGILDLPNSRENEQKLAETLRELYGKDVLVKALLYSTRNHHANLFVFDGIRKKEELEALQKQPNFRLIFIESSLDTRFKRMQGRGEKAGEKEYTKEEFEKLVDHAADKDVKALKNYADFVVKNDGDQLNFESQLTACLMRVL